MTLDAQRAVRDTFLSLPETHRSVLQLARNGHSYADIAQRLDVAPSLVRAWALHAMLALTSARRRPAPMGPASVT